MMSSGQPPVTRARAGSSRTQEAADGAAAGAGLDELVEAVIARLGEVGVLAPAAAVTPKVEGGDEDGEGDILPSPARRRLWLEELRRQRETSANFGIREQEETRGLLIIGEGAGPPPEHLMWYWGRIRLFIIVARHGWAAALQDSRYADMDRLGIHMNTAAAQPPPAPRPAAAPPARWRGRPSRPSGLRRAPGGAAPAPAAGARRAD